MLPYQFEISDVDNLPPVDMFEQFPNWQIDGSGNSKFIADTCHIRPQRNDSRIAGDTFLSACDVWLADETMVPSLICPSSYGALGVVVFAGPLWGLARVLKDDSNDYLQFRITSDWVICDASGQVSFESSEVFPLRYCSRLPLVSTRRPVSGIIDAKGTHLDWDP